MSTTQQIILIVVILIAAAGAIALAASRNGRKRREELRRRFGPEYDRAVEQYGSVRAAERELISRERHFKRLNLRELNEADRVHYANAWTDVQAKFVDDPAGAVSSANQLIKTVMQARGYPVEDFDHRVADLSVEHANVVQHYRAARVLAEANREGRANTEELRQAFVHYRALFADLLQETKLAEPNRQPATVVSPASSSAERA
jgi:hypothetical protein